MKPIEIDTNRVIGWNDPCIGEVDEDMTSFVRGMPDITCETCITISGIEIDLKFFQ